jgi:integrase
MYQTDKSKKKVKSKKRVISNEELYKLLEYSNGLDQICVIGTGFFGLREGELIHLRKDWIHVNDEDSKRYKIDHITVPDSGDECWCDDCMMREYRTFRRKNKQHYTLEGHQQIQKDFYKLKNGGKLKSLFKKHKLIPMWQPKTASGERRIPFIEPNTIPIIVDFFDKNKILGLDRFHVWHRIKQLGLKHLEKKLFPHAMRATFNTILAKKGLNIFTVKDTMGHMDISTTDKYYGSKSLQALKEIKSAYEL